MTWDNVILLLWLAVAVPGWLAIIAMVCVTIQDRMAAKSDSFGRAQIGNTYLRVALGLLVVHSSFLLTALGAQLGVSAVLLRVVLTVGSLAPGITAAAWYCDRRKWERRDTGGA